MTEAEAIEAFRTAMDAVSAGDEMRAVRLLESVLSVHAQLGLDRLRSKRSSIHHKVTLTNIAILHHRMENWRLMLDATDRLLARYPEDSGSWQLQATAVKHIKGPHAGLAAVQRSLTLDPGAADSHHEHACILVSLGRLDEAEDACKEALERGTAPSALLEDDELSPLFSRLGFRALLSR